MGQFTINYPDEKLQDILDAFAKAYNWPTEVDDGEGNMIPNPESKAQHAKRQLNNYVKSIIKANHPDIVSADATAQATKDTVAADAETDIT